MSNMELYNKGYSVNEITDINKLSRSEVEDFIKSITPEDLKNHKIHMRNRIIEMNNNDYTANAISQITSVSLSLIKKILSE